MKLKARPRSQKHGDLPGYNSIYRTVKTKKLKGSPLASEQHPMLLIKGLILFQLLIPIIAS
jgi:hypothetical protein